MRPDPPHRLTVFDAMILVAAAAVATWLRDEFAGWLTVFLDSDRPGPWISWDWCCVILRESQPLVAPFTFAVVVMRFVQPRPRLRRLARQPGFAACLGVSFVILVGGISTVAVTRQKFEPGSEAAGYTQLALTPRGAEPGFAVAATWLMMVVGRRWRPERTWIDRAGIAVGLYWLAMVPVLTFGIQPN